MVLGIYGGGGLGREVLELAKQINIKKHIWDEIVFIDDYYPKPTLNGIKVLPYSKIDNIYSTESLVISIAIGEPFFRKQIYDIVIGKGYRLATLIHPSIYIPDSTEIQEGATINELSFISCNVKIGSNVYIQPQTLIGHDCIVKDHSVISPCASLAGGCHVGECVFVGMGATVREKVQIGSWSIVGMGSVVGNNLPDEVIALGNPARIFKKNEDKRVFI